MKTLLYLLASIVLLACSDDNKLNEEELRTYLIGGKWVNDISACTFSDKYTADSVLMFSAKVKWPSIDDTISVAQDYDSQFGSYAYKIAKIDVANQTIYFNAGKDTVPFKVIAKDTFHMIGSRGYMRYYRVPLDSFCR